VGASPAIETTKMEGKRRGAKPRKEKRGLGFNRLESYILYATCQAMFFCLNKI
jgi:hypothetical protein